MPTSFRPYAPEQDLLLPPSLSDWLPEGHLAYFISEVVEELDLRVFYAPYEGDGRRKSPYEPRMMLKILLYAYTTGVFSSRKIAKKLEEDVAMRVLAANNFPQHRTICDFRKRHLEDFKSIFIQVVQIAHEAGLVRLGTVAIDGTKVKANASKHKAMSYGRMQPEEQRLEQEIAELCSQARRTDEEEDRLYGEDQRGDELPEELQHRQDRLEKIRQAKARLEQAQCDADTARGRHPDDGRKPPRGGRPYSRDFGLPPDQSQSNFSDPHSRIMQTSEGYQQCYNGQLAVDDEFQLIVANALTNNASDNGQLIGLVESIEQTLGEAPASVLPMPVTAVSRAWRNWSIGTLRPMCHWGGKARTAARSMPKTIRPRPEWPPSWQMPMARRVTPDARPWWSRPMVGSRTCWVFAASVYGDCRRCVGNGI